MRGHGSQLSRPRILRILKQVCLLLVLLVKGGRLILLVDFLRRLISVLAEDDALHGRRRSICLSKLLVL